MWEKKVKHSKIFYRLNVSHPGVASLISTARAHGIGQEVANFLRLIEETIPIPLILIDGSENPEKLGDQAQKKAPPEMHDVFRALHASLRAERALSGTGLRTARGYGTLSPLPGIAGGIQGTRTNGGFVMAEADDLSNAVNYALLHPPAAWEGFPDDARAPRDCGGDRGNHEGDECRGRSRGTRQAARRHRQCPDGRSVHPRQEGRRRTSSLATTASRRDQVEILGSI